MLHLFYVHHKKFAFIESVTFRNIFSKTCLIRQTYRVVESDMKDRHLKASMIVCLVEGNWGTGSHFLLKERYGGP